VAARAFSISDGTFSGEESHEKLLFLIKRIKAVGDWGAMWSCAGASGAAAWSLNLMDGHGSHDCSGVVFGTICN
jgi:hypothetical protein